ncbi:MAG: hypothetical protein LBH05_01240 [Deferribacteraceae bacterium]|jgi:hypothetical protein|nr:hypothetical protein [Deferribacteraceae bacterium]
MRKNNHKKIWVYEQKVPKFTTFEREIILKKVKTMVAELPKLTEKVSRLHMRGNRIYLYELVEQIIPEGAILINPLIDDKYFEYPYARISLHDVHCNSCSVDWLRHNNKWMELYSGTLGKCLNDIENDTAWFQ